MTTDTQLTPTDAEIDALNDQFRWDTTEGRRDLTRAALAKWVTPAPVEVEPLSDEQIELLMRSIGTTYADDNDERMKNHAGWQRMNHRQIVRAIEAAHGIKGGA